MNLQVIGKHMKKQDDHAVAPVVDKPSEDISLAEEWKNKYLRALADYQNLEKRSSDHVQEARKFSAEIILSRLLPVVDTFEKVKMHIKDVGFDLAMKELHAVLSEQGVERIEVLGKPFNPHEMECIEVVEGPDGQVVEELLPGFRLYDKVLRVAQVKVGKK